MWAVVYSFLLLIPLSACPSNLGSSMVEQITDVTAKWHHQKRRKLNFWLDYHFQLKCVLPWLNPLVTLFYYILGFDALWVPSFGEHFWRCEAPFWHQWDLWVLNLLGDQSWAFQAEHTEVWTKELGTAWEKSGLDVCSGFTPWGCWGKQVTATHCFQNIPSLFPF